MRIKIIFEINHEKHIPINYNHYLSSYIYTLLGKVDRDFTSFLHEKGYGKGFKLFTFSQIFFEKSKVVGDTIHVYPGEGWWFISSPVGEIIENFIFPLLKAEDYLIIGRNSFFITKIFPLESPAFGEKEKFKMLSPLVLSVGVMRSGKLYHKYLTPWDGEYQERFRLNLIEKYKAVFDEEPKDDRIEIKPDWNYINRRGRITKLVDYKGTKIRGCIFPFEVAGNPELIKLGYEAGFGELNSLGFGMVEKIEKKRGRFKK